MANPFKTIFSSDQDKPQVGSTQEHLPIKSIHDDVIILKDGSVALILQTSAVNFDLLSENEQLGIITSFAQLLNSLNFSIQIVIRSKRLDISQYVESIKNLEANQPNKLLKHLTDRYRLFVESLIQENEVLDKQFFVVISVSYLEIGLINNIERDLKKAVALLNPRRDQVIKQLARIGLKATQLETDKLIRLFYDIYNETHQEQEIREFIDTKILKETPFNAPEPKPLPINSQTQPQSPPPPPVQPVVQEEPKPEINKEPTIDVLHLHPTFTDIELKQREAPKTEENQNAIVFNPLTPLFDPQKPFSQVTDHGELPTAETIHRPSTPFLSPGEEGSETNY